MVLKKILRALRSTGTSIDTELSTHSCAPGDYLEGRIHIPAAKKPIAVEHIKLALVAQPEAGTRRSGAGFDLHTFNVSKRFVLANGNDKTIPFRLQVPWETPITTNDGKSLPGITVGIRTDMAIDRTVDQSDLDPIEIQPSTTQKRILDVFRDHGFSISNTEIKQSHLAETAQRLPAYQKITLTAPNDRKKINVAWVPSALTLDLVLETGDSKTGRPERIRIDNASAQADWVSDIQKWIDLNAHTHK